MKSKIPSNKHGTSVSRGKRPRAMTPNISSPARMKRTARKGKGGASASAPLTITKVEPQMKVVETRRSSAFVRRLKTGNLVLGRGDHHGVRNSLPASASGRGKRAELFGALTGEIAPEIYGMNLKFLARRRMIPGHRTIDRVAAFAAVELGVLAEFLQGRFLFVAESEPQRVVVVPALQVPHAQFALRVPFITGALAGLLIFDLQSCSAHGSSLHLGFGICAFGLHKANRRARPQIRNPNSSYPNLPLKSENLMSKDQAIEALNQWFLHDPPPRRPGDVRLQLSRSPDSGTPHSSGKDLARARWDQLGCDRTRQVCSEYRGGQACLFPPRSESPRCFAPCNEGSRSRSPRTPAWRMVGAKGNVNAE